MRHSRSTCCSTTASPTPRRAGADWLLRAIAGDPADVQIMYGLAGERMLTEFDVTTLPGYRGAAPVRVGNAAYQQYQGDVFGEVMVALAAARELGIEETQFSWPLQRALMSFVEDELAAPRQRHLGDPRSAAPLHPLPRDALGRVRLRDQRHHRLRPGRAARPLGRTARPHPRRDRGTRIRQGPRNLCPVLRQPRASTRRCCSSPKSAIWNRPTRGCSAPLPRSNRTCCTTGCCCATAPSRGSTDCRRASIRSWPARSGWPSSTRAAVDSTTLTN